MFESKKVGRVDCAIGLFSLAGIKFLPVFVVYVASSSFLAVDICNQVKSCTKHDKTMEPVEPWSLYNYRLHDKNQSALTKTDSGLMVKNNTIIILF